MSNSSTASQLLRAVWRKFKVMRLYGWLLRDNFYDLRRYHRWSHGTGTDRRKAQSLHAIYKAYHGVEKGLSLMEPRPGFGRPKIKALLNKLDEFTRRFDSEGVPAAASALASYRSFNVDHDIKTPEVSTYLDGKAVNDTGGTKPVSRAEIEAITKNVGRDFFWSRHSVRQYTNTPVPMDMITAAIDMARKTPSVCNRQGQRVHVFENAQEALRWQPGNAGFGDKATRGLVVTADLQAFSGAGERNQPFVDGGMFAMSLLYALHAQGLGACPLAWSVRPDQDKEMRKALGIPDEEVVIMFISVGHLPDDFRVAKSHRMPLEHFMVIHAEGSAQH